MSTAERLPAAGSRMRPARRPGGRVLRRLPLALLPLSGLLAWQLVIWIAAPREWLLPSPGAVAEVLWSDRERLWFHAQATIAESAVGFALAAVVGHGPGDGHRRARPPVGRAVYPWLVASQAIPILAVAPLVAIWLELRRPPR